MFENFGILQNIRNLFLRKSTNITFIQEIFKNSDSLRKTLENFNYLKEIFENFKYF